jgi:Domain of unknown function (DUF6249)
MYHSMFSPFVIPVAAFAMVLGIVIANNISNYHSRKLQSEERMAAIAKGLPLPEPQAEPVAVIDQRKRARGLRTGGIVCVAVGVGLALFSFALTWIVGEHDVLAVAAAGLIPLAIGIGLLVDYAFQIRDLNAGGAQS